MKGDINNRIQLIFNAKMHTLLASVFLLWMVLLSSSTVGKGVPEIGNDSFLKGRLQQTVVQIRAGKHSFTLQWIGWDKPGHVIITKVEGDGYHIKGGQKSETGGDYIEIEGKVVVVNPKELLFNGKIISQVTYINQGEPCIREGEMTFKSTKNRKYWRLQQMENCEGGNVTDYVDIFF